MREEIARHRKLKREIEQNLDRGRKAGLKVISKSDAISAGLNRYFDGRLCPKGHLSERYVSKGRCIACNDAITKAWREKNPSAYTESMVRYRRERSARDPAFAIRTRVRALISNCITRGGFSKGSKAEQILGCTWEEFVRHIERQFLKGMSWENRHLWHVDHITPMATAQSDEEAIALNHFTNLRPLWADDNWSKSDQIQFLI